MSNTNLNKLKKQAEELGIKTESLTTEKALKKAIEVKESAKDQKSKPLEKAKTLDDKIEEAKTVLADLNEQKRKEELEAKRLEALEADKKDKLPKYASKSGQEYRFKTSAPETLNFDGKAVKTADLIKNKEAMETLITGRNQFIEIVNLKF